MMPLPKIQYPIIKITIPSTKKEHSFRPFQVKEEKILLMAKESATDRDIMIAVKQIINNCNLDDLDVEKLATFDLEYIFIRLRIASVGHEVNVTYIDEEDQQRISIAIDLNKVEIKWPEADHKNIIKITDTTGMVLNYPAASVYNDDKLFESADDFLFQLIIRCVESVYDEDAVYNSKDYTRKELEDFVEQLDVKTFNKVTEFLTDMPTLYYKIEYKNTKGTERTIELRTLNDFFTFR